MIAVKRSEADFSLPKLNAVGLRVCSEHIGGGGNKIPDDTSTSTRLERSFKNQRGLGRPHQSLAEEWRTRIEKESSRRPASIQYRP